MVSQPVSLILDLFFQTISTIQGEKSAQNQSYLITLSLFNILRWLLTALRIEVKLITCPKGRAWPRHVATLGSQRKTTGVPSHLKSLHTGNIVNEEKLILLVKTEYPFVSKVRNLPYALTIAEHRSMHVCFIPVQK